MGDRDGEIDAGDFSPWLTGIERALRGKSESDVPCGTCTACCTSSMFIHIAPDETDTLRHIPRARLFPAPHMPRGQVVLGYDQRGHCPMLIDNTCSIYEHRPRTCRTYDCRIFPAAGVAVDDGRTKIAEQAVRWRFTYAAEADRVTHGAIRAAAGYIGTHDDARPDGTPLNNTTQLAVLAIEAHRAFLRSDDEPRSGADTQPESPAVRVEIQRRQGGDASPG